MTNSASVTASEGDASAGNNAATSPATNVIAAETVQQIPTLSEWAVIALAAAIGIAALIRMRL